MKFSVGDKVFIRVAPFKHMMRFGRKGKSAHKYIGPYEIVERVDKVAYRLALPTSIDCIHDVFHVSLLCKYIGDPFHVLKTERTQLSEDLSCNKRPVQILDKKIK